METLKQLKSKDIKTVKEEILEKQEFKCAICGKPLTLDEAVLDHQHKIRKSDTNGENGNGLVRGVLCNSTYNSKYKNNFVYIIINKENNRKYIGCKSCNEEPYKVIGKTYFSSSRDKCFIQEQKEFPEKFKYIVIKNFKTRIEALDYEIELHNRYNVNINPQYYNKAKQTSTGFDVHIIHEHWPLEVRQKISKANKGKKLPREQILKMIETKIKNGTLPKGEKNPMYGKTHSPETIAKIKANPNISRKGEEHPFYGKHHSEETRRKLSKAHKGKRRSKELVENLRQSNIGSRWMYNDLEKVSAKVIKTRIKEFLEKGFKFGRRKDYERNKTTKAERAERD